MDFIINKVIKRSVTASVGPFILYSSIFYILKLTGVIIQKVDYFNIPAIIALVLVSIVISKIGLYITLRPIEKLFDWLLWVEPGNNWTLKGNFAPIEKEFQFEIEPEMVNEG